MFHFSKYKANSVVSLDTKVYFSPQHFSQQLSTNERGIERKNYWCLLEMHKVSLVVDETKSDFIPSLRPVVTPPPSHNGAASLSTRISLTQLHRLSATNCDWLDEPLRSLRNLFIFSSNIPLNYCIHNYKNHSSVISSLKLSSNAPSLNPQLTKYLFFFISCQQPISKQLVNLISWYSVWHVHHLTYTSIQSFC